MINSIWITYCVINVIFYWLICRSIKRKALQTHLVEQDPFKFLTILAEANQRDIDSDSYLKWLSMVGLNIKILPIAVLLSFGVVLYGYI